MSSELFNKSILIVAHPDDEILWFSSIIDKVDEILVCFQDYPLDKNLSEGRHNVLSQYPMKNISSLGIEEPMSFGLADWKNPEVTKYGLNLSKDQKSNDRYIQSFNELVSCLNNKISGYDNVFTHNPWGEYGHEDHVQVYQAVKSLQYNRQFNLWFQNYCGSNNIKLLEKYISGFKSEYLTLKTNSQIAENIALLYKSNNCWTWYDDYVWFDDETFMLDTIKNSGNLDYGHIFPINLIKTNFASNHPESGKLTGMLKNIKHFIRK